MICLPLIDHDAVLAISIIHPLKSALLKCILVERLFVPVQGIEISHDVFDTAVEIVIEQMPIEASVMIPLSRLSNFCTHKEEFSPRMRKHVSEQQS